MTSVGLKEQIKQLLAQHLSQIQTLMQDAQAKQSESIYAGFVADREDQKRNALEGEISIWQSKMNMGQVAEKSVELSQVQTAAVLQQKVEHKIKQMEAQKSILSSLIDSIREKLAALSNSTDNPLLKLFISLVDMFLQVVENLVKTEEKQKEMLSDNQNGNNPQLAALIENAEDKIESHKELEQLLKGQSLLNQDKIAKQHIVYSQKEDDLDKQDRLENNTKNSFMEKIQQIKDKLQNQGKDLPLEKLMALQAINSNDGNSKVILDKNFAGILDDLVELVGEDKVILDQRGNDRREVSDRRNLGADSFVDPDNRSDIAGRRKGDRRSGSDNIFLG